METQLLTNKGKLLRSVWENPFLTKAEHAQKVGISAQTASKLWKELRADHMAKLSKCSAENREK